MTNKHEISIIIDHDETKFVDKWSPLYDYEYESKYTDNIDSALNDWNSFYQLFQWKNSMDGMSEKKLNSVEKHWGKVQILRELRTEIQNNTPFDWGKFEKEFEPRKTSAIWKIFLLHLVDPKTFPIFDQHVYRSYIFLSQFEIKEIPSKDRDKYDIYKREYLTWFRFFQGRTGYTRTIKQIDQSLFSFGRMLKKVKDEMSDFPIITTIRIP